MIRDTDDKHVKERVGAICPDHGRRGATSCEPKTSACPSGAESSCVKAQREENARHSLRTQRAFSARQQGDHRPGDLLPLGTCCPSAKRRLRERNKHFEETGWLKHSIRHSHAAFGVPFSFTPQACRLSRMELQLYRLDLSVSPIGKGEGDVRDTTFRIAGDPDRAVEEVASSSSLFICYAPLDLRASFHQVGE